MERMERDEAIRILESIKKYVCCNGCTASKTICPICADMTALDMAIKALKIGCQSCQYLKFTEQFVENIVKVMIANDITTIEELKKRIGGSE